jgi:acetyl-CoA synthetase
LLQTATTYNELRDGFEWDIPARYNMGVDVCDKWVDLDPWRTAIIDLRTDDRFDITFGELRDMSNALALELLSQGVKVGDRVGVFRSQSPWTAAAHIAIWKMGAISVPLFKLFGQDALSVRLEDSGAKAVVTDPDGLTKLQSLRHVFPEVQTLLVPETDVVAVANAKFKPVDTTQNDPALIIYTSGTTGAPKGALHAHRVLLGHLPGIEMCHDLLPQQDDVMWTPADWAWVGGLMNILMSALHHGVPVVAARMDKFTPEGCKKIISNGGVRNVFFPPTALKMLKAENAKILGLRSVACGGEPLGSALLDWGKDALGLTINEFYGQTECNMVLSSCNALFEPKAGSIGRPVPGHDVAIIDDHGQEVLGEGDIAVRRNTPVLMLEYWNNPKATADKFRGDWVVTGDRGIVENGYVRFVGRDDDVITSAGYRIGPAEIEDCLITHPAVVATGVVGKPCVQRTELVKAYVILANDVAPSTDLIKDLQDHVKTKLAAHEYPREIEFVDALPMTISGKIIRKDLRARAVAETKGTE